jgi:hypothetical protein
MAITPVRLTKTYLDAPYVSVRWDGRSQRVVSEWKGWANSADFRSAMEMTLRAVEEHPAAHILVDARYMRLMLVEDERWMSEDLIPRMAMTGIRSLAMVTPVNQLAKLIVDDISRGAQRGAGEVKHFETFDRASAWLSSRQRVEF